MNLEECKNTCLGSLHSVGCNAFNWKTNGCVLFACTNLTATGNEVDYDGYALPDITTIATATTTADI
jgi:hypothetical protein